MPLRHVPVATIRDYAREVASYTKGHGRLSCSLDINGLDCFGALGGRILDVLRLVNDLVAEMDVLIEPDVAFEQVIGSDQNLAAVPCSS